MRACVRACVYACVRVCVCVPTHQTVSDLQRFALTGDAGEADDVGEEDGHGVVELWHHRPAALQLLRYRPVGTKREHDINSAAHLWVQRRNTTSVPLQTCGYKEGNTTSIPLQTCGYREGNSSATDLWVQRGKQLTDLRVQRGEQFSYRPVGTENETVQLQTCGYRREQFRYKPVGTERGTVPLQTCGYREGNSSATDLWA